MSNTERLVKMANQIEAFFRAEPDRNAAVEGILNHIKRFWDPRMRKQIVSHLRAGGLGLGELAGDAIKRLEPGARDGESRAQ
jgi:formate dehydrogenase subunit delta